MRKHLETIVVAMVTAALTAAAPALARTTVNADKVDGFDAVACGSSVQNRAGKLVATCPSGFLPSNIVKKAQNSERLDGLDSTDFYRAGSTVADSDLLGGRSGDELTRVAYVSSTDATTRMGRNGKVVQTTITVPTAGFLLVHASSDTYNPKTSDLLACAIVIDGNEVVSSRRWFVVNGVHSDDDCSTDAVVPITEPREYPVMLESIAVDSLKTTFGRTVLSVLFVPFDGTGAPPTP